MTTDHARTRAQIQADIVTLRAKQQRLPESFARQHDQELEDLVNLLLKLEPEPA